jgi:hypothetical protein
MADFDWDNFDLAAFEEIFASSDTPNITRQTDVQKTPDVAGGGRRGC